MGATREEIKSINDSINKLVRVAQVKQTEQAGDKIALLKRVELRFNEMVELRKVFGFFNSEGLAEQEQRMRAKAKDEKVELIKQKKLTEQTTRAARLQAKIEKKQNLVVCKNMPPTFRSRKADFNVKKVENVKVPQDVEDMRRFLGIDPLEWTPGKDSAAD